MANSRKLIPRKINSAKINSANINSAKINSAKINPFKVVIVDMSTRQKVEIDSTCGNVEIVDIATCGQVRLI